MQHIVHTLRQEYIRIQNLKVICHNYATNYKKKKNYIRAYCNWCKTEGIIPLRWDVLDSIFLGCEADEDYDIILKSLYYLIKHGQALSFMDKNKKPDDLDIMVIRLKLRLELFNRVPTATNMILAYNIIEEITLKIFSQAKLDINSETEKGIERFDKLKALAVGTKHINERKLAFMRSVEKFKQLTNVQI